MAKTKKDKKKTNPDKTDLIYKLGSAVLDIFPEIRSVDDLKAILLTNDNEPIEYSDADNVISKIGMPPHIFEAMARNISEETPAFIRKPDGDVIAAASAEEFLDILHNAMPSKKKKDRKKKKKKK